MAEQRDRTIKELADALGVSKTAVRKYMTPEFRCEHVETTENGVITIDSDGCKLIAMHLQRTEKLSETSENQIPETAKTTENMVIPRVVWESLQEQLKSKDQQIDNLTRLLDQEQHLHAGSLQKSLPESSMSSGGVQETVEYVQTEDVLKSSQEISSTVPNETELLKGFLRDAKEEIKVLNTEKAQRQEEFVRNLSFSEKLKMLFRK
ncbi:MAG: hypothetical protein II253_07965 [Lachnospiraceae bacterium]|nr:hypothetical protein [Lachnospiraceae bacterium]